MQENKNKKIMIGLKKASEISGISKGKLKKIICNHSCVFPSLTIDGKNYIHKEEFLKWLDDAIRNKYVIDTQKTQRYLEYQEYEEFEHFGDYEYFNRSNDDSDVIVLPKSLSTNEVL